jgi:class 3 adenylate cyclase
MTDKTRTPLRKALIIFADIIDSSVYSSIMGIEQYANELIGFQKNFEELANSYFPKPYAVKVVAEGDEGVIFFILDEASQLSPSALIYKAIEFAYMLKATMELTIQQQDNAPKKMHIGTGIHLGDVATILNKTHEAGETSEITEVEKILGYAINYAKRVESATRIGKYSKVFLSKTASTYLWEYPVVLEKYQHDLKGISQAEDVYEVRSAYFMKLSLNFPVGKIDNFLWKYISQAHNLDYINEPWLKGFVISVLDTVLGESRFDTIKEKYHDKRVELAWRNYSEDDPIVLMMRALDCEGKGYHTRRLSILEDVIRKYPSFIYAQIEFIRAISRILDDKAIPSELVYARDIALELLEKYGNTSIIGEKEKEFRAIIKKITPKLKAH